MFRVIIRTVRELLKNYGKRFLYAVWMFSYKKKAANKKTFFFVGTGGCGSQWTANIFNSDDEVQCLHDPSTSKLRIFNKIKGEFVKYSFRSVLRGADLFRIKSSHIRCKTMGFLNPVHCEIAQCKANHIGVFDPFISVYAEQLLDCYPRSTFTHVVRHPFNSIEWYLRSKEGNMNEFQTDKAYIPNWGCHTWFERACLWWAYKNRIIYCNLMDNIPSEKWRLVRLEDLTSDINLLKDVWAFAQLPMDLLPSDTFDELAKKRFTKYNVRSTMVSVEEIWNKWTPHQRVFFKKHCLDTALLFGYDFGNLMDV